MIVVGITGASGSILGIRLIECLLAAGEKVLAIVSDHGWKTCRFELKLESGPASIRELLARRNPGAALENLAEYSNDEFFSPAASGTSGFSAVVIIPCSMKTLSGVANGYADNLISRAADVALKEGKKCILVPRETPLNLIHCSNLLKARQAGADIVPPVPGYYQFPKTIDDVTDFIVGKVLDLLRIDHALFKRWEPM